MDGWMIGWMGMCLINRLVSHPPDGGAAFRDLSLPGRFDLAPGIDIIIIVYVSM